MAHIATRPTPKLLARPQKATTRRSGPPAPVLNALDLELVVVDGELAQEWLTRNVSNRVLRKARLAEFKRDMLAGNWRDVGDPIRFDTNGDLCDGQHRITALANAAAINPALTITFLVVRGVQPQDRHVIDTGTRRSASDQLKMAGHKNHSLLATAARWCAMWDRNALYASDSSTKSVTHAEILDYVREHPGLEAIVARVAGSLRRTVDIPPSYIAAGYYLCHRINATEADEFYDRLGDGVGLQARDPILALRSRLRELDKSRANLPGEQWLGLLVRTWNARREGRQMRTIPLYKENVAIPCPGLK